MNADSQTQVDALRAAQQVFGVRVLPDPGLRTDADIAASARLALALTPGLPPDAVAVTVDDGRVSLSGELTWDYQRRLASKAVRYLVGVKGVTEKLTIKSGKWKR